MAEKKEIFTSKMKYSGIADFKDFYRFCYEWLRDETGLSNLAEEEYVEKIAGDSKEIELKWKGSNKFTDYFKFQAKIKMRILGLKNVEIQKDGKNIKTNKGNFEVKISGILIRDYNDKFERSGFLKFIRGIYDKYLVPSEIDKYEDKIADECNKFLEQAKAYLALEGKK